MNQTILAKGTKVHVAADIQPLEPTGEAIVWDAFDGVLLESCDTSSTTVVEVRDDTGCIVACYSYLVEAL
jgi:hypothetical protein